MKFALINPNWNFDGSIYFGCREPHLPLEYGYSKALIERARQLEKHVMVAFIESENRASVHMHQQLGFIHVGQMRQVGCKFGRWLDLTMMQLTLNRTSKP